MMRSDRAVCALQCECRCEIDLFTNAAAALRLFYSGGKQDENDFQFPRYFSPTTPHPARPAVSVIIEDSRKRSQ